MEKMGHARQINYLSKGNSIVFFLYKECESNHLFIKGERRYWREQERMRLQSLAEEQNQIKREASAVNRRPEKASEDDDTIPAPSSYDQFKVFQSSRIFSKVILVNVSSCLY
jgi:hypothetical protein